MESSQLNEQVPEALKMFMKHYSPSDNQLGAKKINQDEQILQRQMARNQILKMDFKMLQKYPIVSMFVVPS